MRSMVEGAEAGVMVAGVVRGVAPSTTGCAGGPPPPVGEEWKWSGNYNFNFD